MSIILLSTSAIVVMGVNLHIAHLCVVCAFRIWILPFLCQINSLLNLTHGLFGQFFGFFDIDLATARLEICEEKGRC